MARVGNPKWRLFPYGAFGALLPSIVSVANKTSGLEFPINPLWVTAGVLYVLAAAMIAAIFPYGRRSSPFNAMLVGIMFPSIIGSASSIAARTLPNGMFELVRSGAGEKVPTWAKWLDAFTLF